MGALPINPPVTLREQLDECEHILEDWEPTTPSIERLPLPSETKEENVHTRRS